MNQKVVKFLKDGLLIPASSYIIFELGKNYNVVKNTIRNIQNAKSPLK